MQRRTMVLFLALIMALTMVFPVAAASQPTIEAEGVRQVEGETIRVGTDAAYPPFEEIDEESGDFVGFDIDLMEAIAEDAGFEIEWINAPFDTIFTALSEGEFDAVISASTITEAREEIIDFSIPYFVASQSISVSVDMAEAVAGPDDLSGLRVGVQLGTTGEAYAQELEGIEISSFDTAPLAFQALGQGDVDAVIVDTPTSEEIIATNPELNVMIVGDPLTEEFYGVAVREDFPELLEAINISLENVIADGTYAELYGNWFDTPVPSMFVVDDMDDGDMGEMGTIADLAGEIPNLSTLIVATDLVGLSDILAEEGPMTIFAPSDEVFDANQDVVGILLSDFELTTRTLQYHIVEGAYTVEDLMALDGETLVSLEGTELSVTVEDGTVYVNGAMIVEGDLMASNGVVHVIDGILLLPETMEMMGEGE